MKMSGKLGLIALVSAIAGPALAANPEVLFYDGFETVASGSNPDAAIWNLGTTCSNLATQQPGATVQSSYSYPVGTNTTTVTPVAGSNLSLVPTIAVSSRLRYWGKLSRATTTTEVCRLSFYQWDDPSNISGSGNGRMMIQLTDYNPGYSIIPNTTTSGVNQTIISGSLQQLVAAGFWNDSGTAPNPGQNYNGGWYGPIAGAPISIGSAFAGRLLYFTGASPIPGMNSGFCAMGQNTSPLKRRSRGWHKFDVLYGPGRTEFHVDGVLMFYVDGQKTATFDLLTLGPNESSSTFFGLYDELKATTYDPGMISFNVGFQNFIGDVTQIPLTVEVVDGGGTVVAGPYSTSCDASGNVVINPTGLPVGNYKLRVGGSSFLTNNVLFDYSTLGSYTASLSLVNGDVDDDGEVGSTDFDTVVANFGNSPATASQGDVDGDGEVGSSDFDIVVANFALGDNP